MPFHDLQEITEVTNITNLGDSSNTGILNVLDFGAVGDGSTPCHQAFTEALTELSDDGALFIPEGTYIIESALLIDNSRIKISGAGPGTVLRFTNAGDALYTDDSEYLYSVILQDLKIETTNAAAGCALYVDGTVHAAAGWHIENISIGVSGAGIWDYGFRFKNTMMGAIENCDLVTSAGGTCMSFETTSNEWDISGCILQNCATGINAASGGINVHRSTMQGAITTSGMTVNTQSGCSIVGCWFELTGGGTAIVVTNAAGLLIAGCPNIGGTNDIVIGSAASGNKLTGIAIVGNCFGPGPVVVNNDTYGCMIQSNRMHAANIITNSGNKSNIFGNYRYDGTIATVNTFGANVDFTGVNTHTAGSLTTSSGVTYQITDPYFPSGARKPYYPSPVDNAVLFDFGFGEGAGATLYDASQAHWDATITGSTWVSGDTTFGGHSLSMNGTASDYFTIPDNAANRLGTSDFTIEIYCYASGGTSGLSKGNSYSNGQFMLQKETSVLWVFRGSAETADYTLSRTTVTDNSWNYLTFVKSGRNFYGYVNGVLAKTAIDYFNADASFDASNNWVFGNTFNGKIAKLRITKRALTTIEVREHYLRNMQSRNIVYNDNFRVIGADGAVDFQSVDGRASAPVMNGGLKALSFGSTIACDMNNGNIFTLTTTGNCTINASNGQAGQRATFIITDDATGGHVVTFGTNFKPSGTLTGTANKVATVDFAYNGTNWCEVGRTTGL